MPAQRSPRQAHGPVLMKSSLYLLRHSVVVAINAVLSSHLVTCASCQRMTLLALVLHCPQRAPLLFLPQWPQNVSACVNAVGLLNMSVRCRSLEVGKDELVP